MLSDLLDTTRIKMEKTVTALKDEFAHIRTGRASSVLVDRIKISYYGTLTPLKQVANISIPESNLIVIQPWDKNCLSEIEKAIWKSLPPTFSPVSIVVVSGPIEPVWSHTVSQDTPSGEVSTSIVYVP